MLQSKHCCCGLCKTDSRCPEKNINLTNRTDENLTKPQPQADRSQNRAVARMRQDEAVASSRLDFAPSVLEETFNILRKKSLEEMDLLR